MSKDSDSDPAASLGSVDEPCIVPRKTIGEARLMRWIPVTERLPDIGNHEKSRADSCYDRCLIWDGLRVFEAVYGPLGWYTENGKEHPTHWMPLPAPPTDDK